MIAKPTLAAGFFILLFLSPLLIPVLCLGQGGPPMVTDDPDTPGNRNWEINLADIATAARSQVLNFVPYFDVNYGVGERLQLKIEGGVGQEREPGAKEKSGAGPVMAGVKWRFWDQERDGGLSMGMFPQFSFHPGFAGDDPEIAPAGNFWKLPIEFSKRFGPFAVNPEVGYQYFTQASEAWIYGVIAAFEPRKNFELLAEVHGDTLVRGGAHDLLFNLGTRAPLNEKVSLLASVGHTIKTLPGSPAQLLAYLGLQVRI